MNSIQRLLSVVVLCVLASCNPDPEVVAPTLMSALDQAYSDTQALPASLSSIEVDTATDIIATLHQDHLIQTSSSDHALIQLLATVGDAENALAIATSDSPSNSKLSTARASVRKLSQEMASFLKKYKDITGWDWEVDSLVTVANNPLYKESTKEGTNPFYEAHSALRILSSNPATIKGSCDGEMSGLTITFTNPVTGASIVSKPTSSQFSTLIDSMISLISIKIAPLNNGLEGTRIQNCRFHAEQSSSGGTVGSGTPLTDSQRGSIDDIKARIVNADQQWLHEIQSLESLIQSSSDSLETKLKNLGILARANNAYARSLRAYHTLVLIGDSGRISPEIIAIADMNLATDGAIVAATTAQLGRENVMFSSISNVLKSRHDAAMAAIQNIR